MNNNNNINSTSSTAPTEKSHNTSRSHKHFYQQQTPNPTLVLGPITREKREEFQHTNSSSARYTAIYFTSDSHEADQEPEPNEDVSQQPNEVTATTATTNKSTLLQRFLVSLDFIMIAILLFHLFKTKADIFQEMINRLFPSPVVVASLMELDGLENTTTQELIKYARMTLYPFLLFLPPLIMISVVIASITVDDTEDTGQMNNMAQAVTARRRKRHKKTLNYLTMYTVSMFLFLTAMITCASTSRWIAFGVLSGAFPATLMILARLSVVHASTSGGFGCVSPGEADWLDWEHWYSNTEMPNGAKILSFIFIFLPFLAGFVYVTLSPLLLLALPLSSLATCVVTGLLGMIPLCIAVMSILLGWKSAHWTLSNLFYIYTCALGMYCTLDGDIRPQNTILLIEKIERGSE